jgi:NAD(P)-dependent dehydrogenase (short-subunit alcohol dehydrogenase family)
MLPFEVEYTSRALRSRILNRIASGSRRGRHRGKRRQRGGCAGGRGARADVAIDSLTVGLAQEVARAILWLLSEEASFATGAFIDIAGGR